MERPKIQSLNFLNVIQAHSVENGKEIFKQLCKQCGGKGFFKRVMVNVDTRELQECKGFESCLECEGGFIYGPRESS